MAFWLMKVTGHFCCVHMTVPCSVRSQQEQTFWLVLVRQFFVELNTFCIMLSMELVIPQSSFFFFFLKSCTWQWTQILRPNCRSVTWRPPVLLKSISSVCPLACLPLCVCVCSRQIGTHWWVLLHFPCIVDNLENEITKLMNDAYIFLGLTSGFCFGGICMTFFVLTCINSASTYKSAIWLKWVLYGELRWCHPLQVF